jgi:hypothetical protein
MLLQKAWLVMLVATLVKLMLLVMMEVQSS